MLTSRKITVMSGDVFRNEYSLTFDGTDDYLNCGDVLDIGTADFTLSIWAKASDWDTINLVSKHVSGNTWRWQTDNNDPPTMRYYGYTGGAFVGTYIGNTSGIDLDLLKNQWVHFALSNDRSGNTVGYINGQYDDSDSSDATDITNSGDFIIGAFGSGSPSAVTISEVAIYNKALSGSEVKTMYNGREPYNHQEGSFARNLTGWWRMGDGLEQASGTTIYDMSDNSNNGTMTNMASDDYVGDTP